MIKEMYYILKKVLIGFLIGVLLYYFRNGILIVKAENMPDWTNNIKYTFNDTYFYDLTSNTGYTPVNLTYYNYNNNMDYGTNIPILWNSSALRVGPYGNMFTYNAPIRFKKNYLYSSTFYYCSSKRVSWQDVDVDLWIGGGTVDVVQRPSNRFTYNMSNITQINTNPGYESSGVGSWEYCQMITTLFVPNYQDGSWLGYRWRELSGKTVTNNVFTFFGYDIQLIGLYDSYLSSELENIVNRSGLASASSVAQVQTSVNQVKQEIQGMQQKQDQTNQKLDELNDNITSEDIDTSGYGNLSDNNAQNGVINQLITMPITLAQSYLNGFNSSCTPFRLGTLYGEELILPCINPENYLGAIWSVIDVIISGIFIFIFGKKLVKIFNDVTNLKENQVNEVFD